MTSGKLTFISCLIAVLSALSAQAQVDGGATKHFEKAGLSFDYPADWKLTESGTGDVLLVNLAPERGAGQIAIIARFDPERNCDFPTSIKKASDTLLERLATQIHAARPLQPTVAKTHVGVAEVEGLQLSGKVKDRNVTGEIYSFRLKLNLVNLVQIRFDDDARANSAWELVSSTLKADTPVLSAAEVRLAGFGNNVLNGRALYLARPDYPPIARQGRIGGQVIVQVVIDEVGKVVSANAISGHSILHHNSVEAAKASKFSPTKLCGEPLRVTGVITFSFVPG